MSCLPKENSSAREGEESMTKTPDKLSVNEIAEIIYQWEDHHDNTMPRLILAKDINDIATELHEAIYGVDNACTNLGFPEPKTPEGNKTILCRLKTAGEPDDGMIAVFTGCINGHGRPSITVINEKCIVGQVTNTPDNAYTDAEEARKTLKDRKFLSGNDLGFPEAKTPDKLRDVITGLHDDIIAIWEKGEQYQDEYIDRVDGILDQAIVDIETLYADNLPDKKDIEVFDDSPSGMLSYLRKIQDYERGFNACLDEIRKRRQESKEGKE